MKSMIPLLAITILATLALVGCNQSSPDNSTNAQSTNSSLSDTNGPIGGTTNMTATNSLPEINTNTPATNSLPDVNTNIPASTNQ